MDDKVLVANKVMVGLQNPEPMEDGGSSDKVAMESKLHTGRTWILIMGTQQ
jgi:hypothetical protein